MAPSIGRIVHYRLSAQDAEAINRRRVARPHEAGWPAGAQAHVGNSAMVGQIFPLIVVWVHDGAVNGQVLLDGNDQLWVTSASEGTLPGTWSWPPRQD